MAGNVRRQTGRPRRLRPFGRERRRYSGNRYRAGVGEKVVATFAGKTGDAPTFLAFVQKGNGASAGPAGKSSPYSSLDGKTIETAGKVVVLNFWATWCVPCLQEIPSFNKLHKEFGG